MGIIIKKDYDTGWSPPQEGKPHWDMYPTGKLGGIIFMLLMIGLAIWIILSLIF